MSNMLSTICDQFYKFFHVLKRKEIQTGAAK